MNEGKKACKMDRKHESTHEPRNGSTKASTKKRNVSAKTRMHGHSLTNAGFQICAWVKAGSS